jgi:hypothetical protein
MNQMPASNVPMVGITATVVVEKILHAATLRASPCAASRFAERKFGGKADIVFIA